MILTNTDKNKKVLGVFWAGEFGHLVMNVIPRINALRKERPDTHIIFASFEGDHIYFRDNNGDWTIDEYIAFPWWACDRGCHEVKGGLTADAKTALQYLKAYNGEVWETNKWTLKDYTAEFKDKSVIAYPFKDILGDESKIGDGNH